MLSPCIEERKMGLSGSSLSYEPLESQGFTPVARYDVPKSTNGWGIRAESKVYSVTVTDSIEEDISAFLRKTDQCHPRLVYVLSGTPYEMGFAMSMIAREELESTCESYLPHLVGQLFAKEFDQLIQGKHMLLQSAYEFLLRSVVDFICLEVERAYDAAVRKKWVPKWFDEELRGILAGLDAQGGSNVRRDQLITVNMGMDWLMAQILEGRILKTMRPWFERAPTEIRPRLLALKLEDFASLPDMCNTFGVYGEAVAGKKKQAFHLRDFQIQNGRWWHRLHAVIVRLSDDPEVATTASVAVPGMVSAVTAMSSRGIATGVNLVRSEAVCSQELGWSATMLVLGMARDVKQAREARSYLEMTHRAVAWIFSIQSPTYGTVMEALPRKWVREPWTKSTLRKPAPMDRKVFSRDCHYRDPKWVREQKVPGDILTNDNPFGAESMINSRWTIGLLEQNKWKNQYYPPARLHKPGIWLTSNLFIHPNTRVTQLGEMAALFERYSTCPQWRYDFLHRALRQQHGKLTWDDCLEIIMFLHPDKEPDYPQNSSYSCEEPLGTPIEGAITAINCTEKTMWLKSGFWGAPWLILDLKSFT